MKIWRKSIIKLHPKMNLECAHREIDMEKERFYEHAIEYNDEEIIITAALKLKIDNKYNKKLMIDMIKKQELPLSKVINKIDKENKINKYEEIMNYEYTLPKKITNIINQSKIT